MNKSFDDLPIEIIIGIIGNLSCNIADYLPLRLVSSRWKYLIDCYFATIKHLVHRKKERKDWELVTRDGLIVCIPTDRRDRVINCIDFFPNLKAVSVDLSKYTKKEQDTLFTYLNTRPTITSLELVCRYGTELQNDVKLENIRNFALNAEEILSEDAISRLFQADHKLTQLYVNTHIRDDLPFEDGNLVLKRMPTLKRLSQQLRVVHDAWDIDNDTEFLIYTKQPGLSFENLESYSFHAVYGKLNFLNYVDNFVACCPNLKSFDCWLSGGDNYLISRLNNLRAHTNVENLAIQDNDSSWEYVLKVLEMFPMVKNLKLKDIKGIGHNQISQALLKLPNLSLLYLRRLDEFSTDCYPHQATVQVDCEALKEEYSSKYGRNLQIVKRDGRFEFEKIRFRHGFNFMQNIFWPDWAPKLLTD